MFLQIRDITPNDIRHLHCTDPALRAEVDAINRSIHRLDEQVSNLDTPQLTFNVSTPENADQLPAITSV